MPQPSAVEVVIALEWAGVGSWDASIRDGSWAEGRTKFPLVPGLDGAGVVVACGARVRRLKIGDRVYAYEFGNSKGGFYAQYVAVHANHADRVPRRLATRDAAVMVTTALTAMQGIDRLRLRKGSRILIFGASGAVGTMAVQIAKWHGATVIATASGRPATRIVSGLGADHVIDARRGSARDKVIDAAPNGLNAILALAGGRGLDQFLDLVRDKGRVVYPNGVEPEPKRRRGLKVEGYNMVADPVQFRRLRRFIEDGDVEVPIAAVYPLSQAARAHRRLERGQVVGRIVLSIPMPDDRRDLE
jgi:NADPH:quinone reductase-like Zn-dependent oxidoreductase